MNSLECKRVFQSRWTDAFVSTSRLVKITVVCCIARNCRYYRWPSGWLHRQLVFEVWTSGSCHKPSEPVEFFKHWIETRNGIRVWHEISYHFAAVKGLNWARGFSGTMLRATDEQRSGQLMKVLILPRSSVNALTDGWIEGWMTNCPSPLSFSLQLIDQMTDVSHQIDR